MCSLSARTNSRDLPLPLGMFLNWFQRERKGDKEREGDKEGGGGREASREGGREGDRHTDIKQLYSPRSGMEPATRYMP